MPLYMTQFSYTTEAWARLARNPQDRAAVFGELLERAGGKLVNFYYSYGEHDGVVIFEVADESVAYGVTVAAITPGHLTDVRTIRLFTTEETMQVLRTAGALPYQAPMPRSPLGAVGPG
jgi:uncharacterized protein with GYD domain